MSTNQSCGRPHQSYGRPHQSYGTPHQSYGEPHQSYGMPHQPCGRRHQSCGRPHQSYGRPCTTRCCVAALVQRETEQTLYGGESTSSGNTIEVAGEPAAQSGGSGAEGPGFGGSRVVRLGFRGSRVCRAGGRGLGRVGGWGFQFFRNLPSAPISRRLRL